jgi:hypothetical protein
MKSYLGDALYADFDGHDVILTTENGVHISNTIYLEPEVVAALLEYLKELEKRA